jgi:hypothetical protein
MDPKHAMAVSGGIGAVASQYNALSMHEVCMPTKLQSAFPMVVVLKNTILLASNNKACEAELPKLRFQHPCSLRPWG